MDSLDKKIVFELQKNGRLSNFEIAEKVGLSPSPCLRRIKNLEKKKVISGYTAIVDEELFGYPVTAFVSVRTSNHNANWAESFSEAVQQFPEVVEFYRMSGDVDYLLRVVVPDIAAYDDFYKRLIEEVDLQDVSSSFAMEELKFTTALPLDYVSHTDNLPD